MVRQLIPVRLWLSVGCDVASSFREGQCRVFLFILPELEGVTVKPLTGYPTEVKPGGKFKFYLHLDADYNESVPVVYVNNEELNVNQEVYSIYNISEKYPLISVEWNRPLIR